MKLSNVFITLIVSTTLSMAIPIELFKSKNGARFNNFGVTMKAKIMNIDCSYVLGYGKSSRKACRALAMHKMKGKRDQSIHLVFDKFNAHKLQKMKNAGNYRFVSCTYTHKKKIMGDCSIK